MASPMTDTIYKGDEKLVVAFDIGTTHSAVTFSYMTKGTKPEVRSVLHWPGQQEVSGEAKIPSLVAYKNGHPISYGAEARDDLPDVDVKMAQWFKLHLHTKATTRASKLEIPELPHGVSIGGVYKSFLGYLYNQFKVYFLLHNTLGQAILNRLNNRIVFIFCIPNGWDIAQQSFLRTAAVAAGLLTENDADERLQFVTEGEASVHFILSHDISLEWLRKGIRFAVMDAGGSTVDSTLYECMSTKPLILQEVCASECVQAGGVFVDRSAHHYLKKIFEGSGYSIPKMVKSFEIKIKRVYDGSQTSNIIQLDDTVNSDTYKISKGRFFLSKREVALIFEKPIGDAVQSCQNLLSGRGIQHVLLVGGFGESPYLRSQVRSILEDQGTTVTVAEQGSKKAAAEGAIIWYLKQLVHARAMRCTYGLEVEVPYDDVCHNERKSTAYKGPSGQEVIHAFDPLINKHEIFSSNWERVQNYYRDYTTLPDSLETFRMDIFAWEYSRSTTWVRNLRGEPLQGMSLLCVIEADMSGLKNLLAARKNAGGVTYWRATFQVVLTFDRIKLQAKLRWRENGVTCEGPATILPSYTF